MKLGGSAIISPCEQYRYVLRRDVSLAPKKCTFIMLNPSTADALNDDPTIRRCMSYARDWGCGELIVVNLFAFRATSPKDMIAAHDPIGPDNDHFIKEACAMAQERVSRIDYVGPIVCAWGANGTHMGRGEKLLKKIDEWGFYAEALRLTKKGAPGHPLYLPKDLEPTSFEKLKD